MIFKRTIASTMLRNWVVGAFAAIVLVGGAWLRSESVHFRKEADRIRTDFLERRKDELKEQVDREVDRIAFLRSQARRRARESVRATVAQAHATASFLRDKHAGRKDEAEIQAMILDALRPIRFNRGRGYCFAFRIDGFQLLNGGRPELEGKSLISMRDARGAALFRDMIAIARVRGEGFYEYRWSKPGAKGNDYAKISYVKRFEPYGWVIGAGEYLEDADLEIREEEAARIAEIRFGDGGRMAAVSDGGIVAPPGAGGISVALTGRDGPSAVRALRDLASRGGGFLTKIAPAEAGSISPVVYFAREAGGWGWTVAAGSGIRDVEAHVEKARAEMTGRFWRAMGKILALLALLFLGAVGVARHTASRLRDTFERFSAFFRKAASEAARIEPEGLLFDEFRELAESANAMVDERQRAESRVARLAAAVEQAAEDIVITDPAGIIEYVNPSFEATTGFLRGEAVGKTCRILNGGAQDPAFYKDMWDTIRSGKIWKGRFRNRTKDGRLILQDANIAPIRDARGDIAGFVSVRSDVTEHAEMEARLAESQRLEAIGTLAGGIAHDFNNILTAIVGYTEMSLATLPPGSPLRDNLSQVLTGGKRATELVRQILAFSRRNQLEKRPVRIDDVVRETLKLLRAAVPSTIRIVPEIETTSRVLANPTQIYQVVMNLCTNASAAMGETGGTLRVSLSDTLLDAGFSQSHPGIDPGEHVRLSVEDDGCGMAPELIPHIFEPFFTTRLKGGGTGMGLAVVHGIVYAHGGAIDVTSEPGRGSRFDVYLPTVPESESVPRSVGAPVRGGSERILFVDDEEAIRNLLSARLSALGYRVTGLTDSREALARFRETPGEFDLLVSDVTMPGMTGDRLAREVRSIRPDLPIILCSGYTERVGEEAAREMGISAFIPKPVSFRHLAGAVRSAIDRSLLPQGDSGPL